MLHAVVCADPRCRGTVIGVLKAFLGLSGSFFTTIYVSFLEPDAVAFLLMLAAVPAGIVLACTLFINYVPYIQIEPHTKARPALCPPLHSLTMHTTFMYLGATSRPSAAPRSQAHGWQASEMACAGVDVGRPAAHQACPQGPATTRSASMRGLSHAQAMHSGDSIAVCVRSCTACRAVARSGHAL